MTLRIVKDINNNPSFEDSFPDGIIVVGNNLFFSATTVANGNELWLTDGTAAGTKLVKDIRAGATGSFPANLTSFNNKAFFTADDGSNGTELWSSDGTAAGTNLFANINPGAGAASSSPSGLTVVGTKLFFAADNGPNGRELWVTDGTAAGTTLVTDILVGAIGSFPSSLTSFNNKVFFAADNGPNGVELWQSDGTAAGTTFININAAGSSSPSNLTVVGTKLFFVADNGTGIGRELAVTDGTAAGTTIVKDILAGATSSLPSNLTSFNGRLFFSADDGANGVELWSSDGTPANTNLFANINTGIASSNPSNFKVVGNKLFFVADNGTNGSELWVTDGTAAGTTLVKDIRVGTNGSFPFGLTAVDENQDGTADALYFSADDGANGEELWRSDGTAAGTTLVKNLNFGTNDSFPFPLVNFKGSVYFGADNGLNGSELWKTIDPSVDPDINGDTNPDILLQDTNFLGYWEMPVGPSTGSMPPPNIVFRNLSNAKQPDEANVKIVGAGDFNGNGKAEIVVQNQVNNKDLVRLWEVDATGNIVARTDITGSQFFNNDIVGVRDYSGDGVPDLLIQRKTGGANAGYLTMGGDNGNEVKKFTALPSTNEATIRGATDLDGDKQADILLHRKDSPLGDFVGYWKVTDGGLGIQYVDLTTALFNNPAFAGKNATVIGAADINNDGIGDLLIQNAATNYQGYFTIVNGGLGNFVQITENTNLANIIV